MKQTYGYYQLTRLVVDGFKSIAHCDLKLGAINILIGSNGAGKSNLISFFRMVQQMLDGNLQVFVSKQGGPDSILHFGRKTTELLNVELYFGNNGYLASFEPTKDNRLMISRERSWWNMNGFREIGSGSFETAARKGTGTGIDKYIVPAMEKWRVYHFHDTSDSAHVKQPHRIDDNEFLRSDARNLAGYLYFLQRKHPSEFSHIEKTVNMVAPFFGRFHLRPSPENENVIELEWFEIGQEVPFKAYQLSDGTLRFICLATVFLQPSDLQPETILVDEPELGLHPYAVTALASLIRSVSKLKQVIVSTQSVELLNEFEAEDVVVVDRVAGKSQFQRLDTTDLTSWLEEYSLGELWKKNLLGGRPSR